MQKWTIQAPSNIALIKYMGKQAHNMPDNPSLSYTLPKLRSIVSLEPISGDEDILDVWQGDGFQHPLHFSALAARRFLDHLQRIKEIYDYSGAFLVRSNNNFPMAAGLASSASSFAALTQVAVLALSTLTQSPLLEIAQQAQISREGSGSSCRSFYAPWVLWQGDIVEPLLSFDLPCLHRVIVVHAGEKAHSSSEAHQRVRSSPLYEGRAARAQQRCSALINAFERGDWAQAYSIVWEEFQDMHHLFSTAVPSFSYMQKETTLALQHLQEGWERSGDGPLVTMDAGPNIHLLYRLDQEAQWEQLPKQAWVQTLGQVL
ncbi:MAG: diphosphomevalonate decarboxylase [Legionellaceae bacterium]|nr:diphosphomevalonate decarboxylase [Legionellaceae bacterium]